MALGAEGGVVADLGRVQALRRQEGGPMDDAEVLGRINELAREEHELFERES